MPEITAFQFDYLLTGIDDNFAGNYLKHKQTSYFEMYAYNCNPRLTLLGIYHLFVLCNSSLGLFTWQEINEFLLDTQCIQQTGYGWVGCKLRHMCSLEVNVKDW